MPHRLQLLNFLFGGNWHASNEILILFDDLRCASIFVTNNLNVTLTLIRYVMHRTRDFSLLIALNLSKLSVDFRGDVTDGQTQILPSTSCDWLASCCTN